MPVLNLHGFHESLGAAFASVNGCEVVAHYGDPLAEHAALRRSAVAFDLGFRSRLCVLGGDRERFLNGQVTNDVKALRTGQGCYAAVVTAKGRMESDLFIHRLADEFLLDFEPGLSAALVQRLERYVIADDVQLVDVAPAYGLLSVQGPRAAAVVAALGLGESLPAEPLTFRRLQGPDFGEGYLMNQPRVGLPGFDLFVPAPALAGVADRLVAAARGVGGIAAGWQALELARVEAGIPRFGVDMDDTNLPPEAGLEARAISYRKGCYIGQEVIARVRTYGQVAKALRGLRLEEGLPRLPAKGDVLLKDGKEVGFVTSAAWSPFLNANLALGYVRRECNETGTVLTVRTPAGESEATITPLPFVPSHSDGGFPEPP
jgi:folate-binding protein YgfZ